MAGLLDPTDDIVTPEERKAITQQNFFNTLLQGGMQLVAGGENLLPWQRAQMIGQAAQTFGGMPAQNQQMLANAAQQKLAGQKYREKKQEREYLNSEEFKSGIAQLPLEMQVLARLNPQAAMSAVGNWKQMQISAQAADAAATRQERTLQAQLDRQPPVVKNDEYGRMVVYDPVTKAWSLVNMGNVNQRAAFGLPDVTPAQQGGGAPQSSAVATVPPSINTQSVDYRRAFGLGGFNAKIAGIVQDILEGKMTGGNLEAANARNNYNQVRNEVLKVLTTGMPGRESKYTTQMVSETLPESGAAFQGPSGAVSKLDAANRMVESEIKQLESAFDAPGNIKMRADIAGKLKDLYRAQANLTAISQQITYGKSGAPNQAKTAAGPTPEQAREELLRREKIQ